MMISIVIYYRISFYFFTLESTQIVNDDLIILSCFQDFKVAFLFDDKLFG